MDRLKIHHLGVGRLQEPATVGRLENSALRSQSTPGADREGPAQNSFPG